MVEKILRSPAWLWLSYIVVQRIPIESICMVLAFIGCVQAESAGTRWRVFLIEFAVIWVVSVLVRIFKKTVVPKYMEIDKILQVDYNTTAYKDGSGARCVKAKVSYGSFDSGTLKGENAECVFRIYTYLDFQSHFANPENAIRHILTSIPCHRGSVAIGGGDSCSCWVVPQKYRTPWGLVERVTNFWGCEL